MSKTAEQVALDAVSGFWAPYQPSVSGAIVSALRSAGWLREAPNDDLCPGCYNRIAQLERDLAVARQERDEAERNTAQAIGQLDKVQRERDEALKGREYWLAENKKLTQHYDGALERLRASAASPEVMRVIDAVRKHKAAYWSLYVHKPYDSPEWRELAEAANALDALSASRQPKAQEPRYKAEGCEVWDTVQRQADGSRRLLCRFYGIAACGAAQEHAARLNGEGGGR